MSRCGDPSAPDSRRRRGLCSGPAISWRWTLKNRRASARKRPLFRRSGSTASTISRTGSGCAVCSWRLCGYGLISPGPAARRHNHDARSRVPKRRTGGSRPAAPDARHRRWQAQQRVDDCGRPLVPRTRHDSDNAECARKPERCASGGDDTALQRAVFSLAAARCRRYRTTLWALRLEAFRLSLPQPSLG